MIFGIRRLISFSLCLKPSLAKFVEELKERVRKIKSIENMIASCDFLCFLSPWKFGFMKHLSKSVKYL